jgi:hypothetical protein
LEADIPSICPDSFFSKQPQSAKAEMATVTLHLDVLPSHAISTLSCVY